MSELNVDLTQIDRSDLPSIKNIISNGGFKNLFDENTDFMSMDYLKWAESVIKEDQHAFAIRVSKHGEGAAARSWLVGVCGLLEVDWISRHAKIFFVMVDKDGHRSTLQNHPASLHAFKTLLDYTFKELCLNKVWISVFDNNDIKQVLSDFHFVSEGTRRRASFMNGRYRDEHIMSLTIKEYMEKVR